MLAPGKYGMGVWNTNVPESCTFFFRTKRLQISIAQQLDGPSLLGIMWFTHRLVDRPVHPLTLFAL